ncbi:MAG: sugar phosphate isomerase/epimerase [Candidatus Heimdallarchaeota archaeon]|nr:sugar phosphate isomerase/epimerase [Candidatus Heimdallarchaeota archaeon]
MGLLFGIRPFEFSDFFELFKDGNLDLSRLNYVEIVRKNIDAGFKHIEITGDLAYVLPGVLTQAIIEDLVKIKEEESISFSVHLPLWAIEPAAFAPEIRKASVEIFVNCINLTKPLDPLCWVMHPTGSLTVEFMNMNLPEFAQAIMMQQFTLYATEAIKQTLELTGIEPRKLAIENIEYPFDIMYPIIQQLDLSICFDTGHLLAGFSGNMGVIEFLENYYCRIIEFHIHDGEYPRVDHKVLGKHKLPVRELLLNLIDKNYQGPLVYELNHQESLESMEYVKKNVPEALD